MNVCNDRDVTTNVVEIEVDGSNLSPPVAFSEIRSELVGKTLKPGIGFTGMPVYAKAEVEGVTLADLPRIKMDNLIVRVWDGFI